MGAKILVVDDDEVIADLLKAVLKAAGFTVHCVGNADSAFAFLRQDHADLVVLDICLPGISGLKLLELLRQEPRTSGLPVMLLSALGAEDSKVRGLVGGADDYMVKPMSPNELVARVISLLRRTRNGGQREETAAAGGIQVNFDRQEVLVQGRRVDLTRAEFELLATFMRRPGYVLSYENLSRQVSGPVAPMTSGNLYAHIKNLRRKLGRQGGLIRTVYGTGYRFAE